LLESDIQRLSIAEEIRCASAGASGGYGWSPDGATPNIAIRNRNQPDYQDYEDQLIGQLRW